MIHAGRGELEQGEGVDLAFVRKAFSDRPLSHGLLGCRWDIRFPRGLEFLFLDFSPVAERSTG